MAHTATTVRCPCGASLATLRGGALDVYGARTSFPATGGTILYCNACSQPKIWRDYSEVRQPR